ncbi:hypothetical protein NBE98_05130 [Clostridium swellfunianum]|uniref:hypothetical protein n=1 Tax=Clostridium swellfunianum TaxID=1367462 RepID=UPI00202E268C|nr:hypothetical protein [Clostridium swellfunianum]MCM0647759.1 hypothetical protein [Clostridium swellfunianum]
MYYDSYNKLFWGMFLVVFNFNIGFFDILPNFVGYMLILSALINLEEQNPIFKRGKIPASILIVISLIELFKPKNVNLLEGQFGDASIWIMILSSASVLISLYMYYIICKGIFLVSESRGEEQLKENARDRYRFYFILNVIFIFYMPFSLNMPKDVAGFMFIPLILNIVAALLLMGLFRKSKELIKD